MHGQRNNLLAGVLVVVAVVGMVVAVAFLGGGIEQFGKAPYVVRFPLDTDVAGLKPGSVVNVGGLEVGSVRGLEFSRNDAGDVDGIEVRIGVANRITLREGAEALLETPLLGSAGVINFEDLGTGAELMPGAELPGRKAPLALMKQAKSAVAEAGGELLEQAGHGAVQRSQWQAILANADEGVGRFNDTMGDLREEGGPLDDLSGTLDNANSVTMEFRASWEEQWSGDIDAVITSGRRLFEQDLADRMEQIRALLDDAQGYMSPENRDNFANILERGSGFADDLDGRIKDSALGLLDAAKEAVNDAKESIIDFAREEQPNVRKMLANMRLSTDQLRNTMVEVRRAPWRLLYRPGDRELNFELLYDSARSYAEAVSDLRAASESLRVVAGDATPGTADARRVETLTDDVGRAYERYQEAEARFFELLRGEG